MNLFSKSLPCLLWLVKLQLWHKAGGKTEGEEGTGGRRKPEGIRTGACTSKRNEVGAS